jgi:hypothetical protein
MVYGDDEQVVHETFEDVDVVHDEGWTVLFRGDEAILGCATNTCRPSSNSTDTGP